MAEKLRSKVIQPPGPRLTSVQNPCAVKAFSYQAFGIKNRSHF